MMDRTPHGEPWTPPPTINPDADSARAIVRLIIGDLDAFLWTRDESYLESVKRRIDASHEWGRQWGAAVSAEARDMAKNMPLQRGY